MVLKRFVLVFIVLLLVGGSVLQAQDEGGAVDPYYPDVPRSRAEDGAFVLGDPDAPVVVVEFADYLCSHCQTYDAETVQAFIEQYVVTGKARYEFRGYPIIDENFSPFLMALAECAAESDMFWEAHHIMFEMAANGEIDGNIAENFAQRTGLNPDDLMSCITGVSQFAVDAQFARDMGVRGTPAVRVRVGDLVGAIQIDGVKYERGGPPLEILGAFVESENPEELVALVNQLRDPLMFTDDSLVTGEPCAAPCWYGITPGETSFEDAVAIVEGNERFVTPQVEEAEAGPEKQIIFAAESGELCCQVYTGDGEVVMFIRLLMAPGITLGEVVEAVGEPAYLIGTEYTADQAYMDLIYPDVNIFVSIFVDGAAEGALSEDSEVISVQYLAPDEMDGVLEGATLHAWEGYASYADYMNGEFELNPPES